MKHMPENCHSTSYMGKWKSLFEGEGIQYTYMLRKMSGKTLFVT